MDALPELDIQEDLEELDDEVAEEVVKEPSVAQPEDIFAGKPTNGKQAPPKPKKRPVSEKQRAHLDRIRVKALESKAEKQRLKKETQEKFQAEHEARKSAKKEAPPKPEPTPPPEPEPQPLPEVNTAAKEQSHFITFMENMERFETMKHERRMSAEARVKDLQPPKPKPKPAPEILQVPHNPYQDAFDW